MTLSLKYNNSLIIACRDSSKQTYSAWNCRSKRTGRADQVFLELSLELALLVCTSKGISWPWGFYALIKKKIRFSSYIRNFRMEQLQSHIWGLRQGFLIYEEMGKYLTIYKEAVSYVWLCNCSILKFPYIWGSFDFLFNQCTLTISLMTLSLCLRLPTVSSEQWPVPGSIEYLKKNKFLLISQVLDLDFQNERMIFIWFGFNTNNLCRYRRLRVYGNLW